MNTTSTRSAAHSPTPVNSHTRMTRQAMDRQPRPVPRSTTRVIWTMSAGAEVHFGEIA
jgi:hypothetical protein